MLETTDFFEAQIKQCRDSAARSSNKNDREFWLKMANRWEGLLQTRQPGDAGTHPARKFRSQHLRFPKRRRAAWRRAAFEEVMEAAGGQQRELSVVESMNASPDWPRNRLLLALPSRNLKRLMPELEQIRCQRAQILMNADSSLDHVFFPDSGVVSVVAVYADGSIIEMATIGREGCSGVQAILGAKRSSVQLLVQLPGSAAKMSRTAFTRAMQSIKPFSNRSWSE
jgi:hypothetical protein